jgi:hypothetical protein
VPDPFSPPQHERPTLGAQLARQHELLMAQATKSARQGSQSATLTERTTGANSGDVAVKVELVQHDDEDDVAFLGRIESFGRKAIAVADKLNAERRAREQAGTDEEVS